MIHKSLQDVTIKNADRGEVTAVFSTFDVVDHDGDVTLSDAFRDGAPVRISAYGHTTWGGALPVGKGSIRVTDAEAVVDAAFFLGTTAGRDTFEVVKQMGDLQEWSYGYDIVDSEAGVRDGEDVRVLKRLEVHEVSPVLLGAGVGTRTLAVKEHNDQQPLSEHATSVLAGVDELISRAEEVVALRNEKGKNIGEVSQELLRMLDADLTRLRAALKPLAQKAPNEDSQRDALAAQYLRFVHHLNKESH